MRRIAAACLLMLASLAKADPATQPATPSVSPAAQPVCDVYIAPFTALGDNSLDWAGKAVSQNLLTDLARKGFHPLESEKAVNGVDAMAAGKAVNAKVLITGTYQTVELQVRFDGQLIDINTGNVVGGLSATGSPRDLFALEDSLSAQAIAELNQAGTTAVADKPTPIAPALQPPALVQLIQPPAVAAPNAGSAYEGSALQAYVDSNRTPSTDFSQQVQNAQDAQASDFSAGYGGYGFGFYVGIPSYGYGYGYGVRSGGFGRGFGTGFGGGFGGGFRGGHAHDHAEEH